MSPNGMNAALSVCSLVEGASPPTYRRDGGAGAADIRGGEERERRQNGKVEVPDTKTRTVLTLTLIVLTLTLYPNPIP